MRALLGLLLMVAAAVAQAKPDSEAQAADKVLAAVKAKDAAALKALAKRDKPDPWLVADELCFRGKHDAAEAFAKAAARVDTEKLPVYVASRRDKEPRKAARDALATAARAIREGDAKATYAALAGLDTESGDVASVRILLVRAPALVPLERPDESRRAYLSGAALAARIGWLSQEATGLREAGSISFGARDWRSAELSWKRLARLEHRRSDQPGLAWALRNIGLANYRGGNLPRALEFLNRALRMRETLPGRVQVDALLNDIGNCHRDIGEFREAAVCYERAVKEAEAGKRTRAVAISLVNLGTARASLGQYDQAVDAYERGVRFLRKLNEPVLVAATVGNVGRLHAQHGAYDKAMTCYRQALDVLKGTSHREWTATAHNNIGGLHQRRGEVAEAAKHLERARAIFAEIEDDRGVGRTLLSIGLLQSDIGNYAKAMESQQRAAELLEKVGDRAGVAYALGNIASIHQGLGSYSKALEVYGRVLADLESMEDYAGVATALGNIGDLHRLRGDMAAALRVRHRAIEVAEAGKLRPLVVNGLGGLGALYADLGQYKKALGHQQRARAEAKELGDPATEASALLSMGAIHAALGEHAEALALCRESLALREAKGDRAGAVACRINIALSQAALDQRVEAKRILRSVLKEARSLGNRRLEALAMGNLAFVLSQSGETKDALELEQRALALSTKLALPRLEVSSWWRLSHIHLQLGKPKEAARAARRGIGELPRLVGRLGDEQGASAMERWAGLMENGIVAGWRLKDPAEVLFFLESGRAGTLLESLGGRAALGEALIPLALREQEAAARARERRAEKRYRPALDGEGDVDALWAEVQAAREAIRNVVERIRSDRKAQADLTWPQPAALSEIQSTLGAEASLVLFALAGKDVLALVIEPAGARIVELGEAGRIEAVAEALTAAASRPHARGMTVPPHARTPYLTRRLRQLVIEPLELSAKTKRLLLSPTGRMSYLPLGLLTEREVVFVPSGTTYALLARQERAKRGVGVLALGDPDYGERERPLPESGKEARAIGDILLTGKHAGVDRLGAAIAAGAPSLLADAAEVRMRGTWRWRAVHLGCHGRIDTERPGLSELVLAPTGSNVGLLRCLDVYRMAIPADLVVLSACETGKGRIYKAEGVVGFVRAFMMAGAPRVIVSLWTVEDEATRALMVKFYELWKPGKMDTATALKEAQEYVAGHEQWKHPYYWAAWQLWGLPD